MTTSSAKEWANFLAKLGYKATKKYITDYIITRNMNDDEVWNYFVEGHSLLKKPPTQTVFTRLMMCMRTFAR